MIYGFLFGFLFVALTVAGIVLAMRGYGDDKAGMKVSGIITGVLSFILFLCIPFSFHTIDSGEIAVVKEMGKIIDTREAGVQFDFWMVRKYEKYDIKVRQIDITTSAYTAGDTTSGVEDEQVSNTETKAQLQPIDLQLTVHYQVNKDSVKQISLEYGNLTALESRISSVVTAKIKEVVKKYEAAQLISERDVLASEVLEAVNTALGNDYHVTVKNVALTNIDFSDAFEQSVEQSMIAQQELVKAKAEAEKAKAKAQGDLEVAKLQAQAKLEAAKADAEAQKVVAQAEATALKLKSIETARALGFKVNKTEIVLEDESTVIEYEIDFTGASDEQIALLAEYMQYIEYLSKWDGKLPTVMTDAGAIIQLPATGVTQAPTTP